MALAKHGSKHLIGEADAKHNSTYEHKYGPGENMQI